LHVSSDLRLALLFILPTVVLVAVLMYYPMARVVKESLYKTPKTAWLDPNPPQTYVGLEHYEKLVDDPVFKQILTNSLTWTTAAQGKTGTCTRYFVRLRPHQDKIPVTIMVNSRPI